MKSLNIARRRLLNQHLEGTRFNKPDDVVGWLGAVQAQDYAGAKWGVAQRTKGTTDASMDQAFAEGSILRTHVMRPTWHFVTPADIRWILELTAPRVNAANARYYGRRKLDESVFAQSNAVLAKALRGGNQLARAELAHRLERAGLTTATDDPVRLAYILMRAELEGIICSGARRGKQFTYALLDERAPNAKTLRRDEALVELTRRYFTGHGPATIKDYIWWSGLSATDARAGLEMIKSEFAEEVVDGKTYWSSRKMPTRKVLTPTAHLLPPFDEYTIAYQDHRGVVDPHYTRQVISSNGRVIVIDGRVVGTWKRTFNKDTVVIGLNHFTLLTRAESKAVAVAARQYGAFLGMPIMVERVAIHRIATKGSSC